MLDRTLTKLDKELDLVKIVHKLRMVTLANIGLLSAKQRSLVSRMSEFVVKSSSDDDEDLEGFHIAN